VRTQEWHNFVAPAFKRALWNQADTRLKASATKTRTEFSRILLKGRGKTPILRVILSEASKNPIFGVILSEAKNLSSI